MRRDLIKYRYYKEYQLPKKSPNIKSTQSICKSLVLYSENSKLRNYNEEEKSLIGPTK